jgi:hypothetical protein
VSSCGFRKRVHVETNTYVDKESIPEGFAKHTSFKVIPTKYTRSLETKEIKNNIENILIKQGYQTSHDNPDYYLLFAHSVEKDKATRTAFDFIPGKTETTQGSISSIYPSFSQPVMYTEEKKTPSKIVTYEKEYDLFVKHLYIEVYHHKEYINDTEAYCTWQGHTTTGQEDRDFRKAQNYLLTSLFTYFGQSTEKTISNSYTET